jgi:hypothetical protein
MTMNINKKSIVSIASLAVATLGLAASLGAQAATMSPKSLLGDPVSAEQGLRTVEIKPGTKFVNVDHGEIIKFVANGKEFGFNFDDHNHMPFNLQQVAPAGVLDHQVMVYENEGPADLYVR